MEPFTCFFVGNQGLATLKKCPRASHAAKTPPHSQAGVDEYGVHIPPTHLWKVFQASAAFQAYLPCRTESIARPKGEQVTRSDSSEPSIRGKEGALGSEASKQGAAFSFREPPLFNQGRHGLRMEKPKTTHRYKGNTLRCASFFCAGRMGFSKNATNHL